MNILLAYASLFPRQVGRFFLMLGRRAVALVIAFGMPLMIGLGLGEQPERSNRGGSLASHEPLTNLIFVTLPPQSYEEVPPTEKTDRHGRWEDWKDHPQREIELVGVVRTEQNTKPEQNAVLLPQSALLHLLLHLQINLTHPPQTIVQNQMVFQTILPQLLLRQND